MQAELIFTNNQFDAEVLVNVNFQVDEGGIGQYEYAGQQGFDGGYNVIHVKDWTTEPVDITPAEVMEYWGVAWDDFVTVCKDAVTETLVAEKLYEEGYAE